MVEFFLLLQGLDNVLANSFCNRRGERIADLPVGRGLLTGKYPIFREPL